MMSLKGIFVENVSRFTIKKDTLGGILKEAPKLTHPTIHPENDKPNAKFTSCHISRNN